MKQLERLLLHQGQRCFFCDRQVSQDEASVEHIVALANGGDKDDSNCVACCKTLNAALGHMSVKEKLRVILAQRAAFVCPTTQADRPSTELSAPADAELVFASIVENLRKREKRPGKLVALERDLGASFPKAKPAELARALERLQAEQFVKVEGAKVFYPKFDVEV